MSVRLGHAGWKLELLPDLGGAVAAFRRDGTDIFRPTPPNAKHPLETACFPLVPYANRIADGRFTIAGEAHALPRNVEGQAHPLHGAGWLSAWTVTEHDDRQAALTHGHDADTAWPWSYTAEQSFTLGDDGLRITLSVTNRDDRPMPVSLGLHPYFTKLGVRSLWFEAEAMWLTDAGLLPTELAPANHLGDWAAGETIERTSLIDNSYTGWSGAAIIAREGGDLRLSGENTPILHLFTPPGEAFFCVEPVTAMPDALNRAAPLMMQPGESHAIVMAVTAI